MPLCMCVSMFKANSGRIEVVKREVRWLHAKPKQTKPNQYIYICIHTVLFNIQLNRGPF